MTDYTFGGEASHGVARSKPCRRATVASVALLLFLARPGAHCSSAVGSAQDTVPSEQQRRALKNDYRTNIALTTRGPDDDGGGEWGHTEGTGPGPQDSLERPAGRQLTAKRKRLPKRRPARNGAYVSLGKVRAFTGDVYPSPSLVLALENRSYKRELILVTDSRPRTALQLFHNLAQLGLVHALWLTSSHSSCASMADLAAKRDALIRQRRAMQQASVTGGGGAAAGSGTGGGGAAAATSARALLAADGTNNTSGGGISAAVAATLAAAYIHGGDATETVAPDDMMGCAWYSQPFPPGFTGHRRLMMKRIMLLARIVRLGYNVLSLDTDVIIFRDPYPLLKAPPYNTVQMVVGKSIRSNGVANTGVVYVHNASRSGPVAWVLSEVVQRNMRWVEHNISMPHMEAAAHVAITGAPATGIVRLMPQQADSRGCWDQFLFGDVVLTGVTGKLVLLYCARPVTKASKGSGGGGGATGRRVVSAVGAGGAGIGRRGEEEDGGWTARHYTAMNLEGERTPTDLMTREVISVEDDPALVSLVGGKTYAHFVMNFTIPHNPEPLLSGDPGYRLPPVQPGGTADGFLKVLQADASLAESRSGAAGQAGAAGRHLQQGVAQSKAVEAAGAAIRERIAYAADWLIGGWPQRGALGYWDPTLTHGKPKQVFGHLVRAPGPTNLGKDAVRMLYGEYDWELAALAAGGPYPFLGSPDAGEPPRLVALHPDVDTSTISLHQWTNTARGLAQIALLTGRRVVWPSVPCDSDWVQPNPGSRRALPFNMNLRFLAHGTFSDGLICTPATILHQKCLYARHVVQRNYSTTADVGVDGDGIEDDGGGPEYVTRIEGPRGILPWEFALLRRLLPSETEPGPHNTVHLQGTDNDYDDGGERPIMFDEPPRTEGVAYVKASSILKPLREGPLAAERVLYLAQRTFVSQLKKLDDPDFAAKYRAFRNECPALR
ncbi:hypothetical protein GPECTOR_96g740 [Gonium pectorale]|uniref:Nucleotide-diphospho-sugar transferase domain-containing protein n=1 Tax=Gonium pectorale TaxID=33097 RepID=A0A150G0A1_GONPE|nr:hypothetical protein GPECTOR_96g740 [Gonium pectorale]|eukprot:KXZ43274.1 hypothetical protein GPECTOR_96g740 [Gonium pectorale]